MIVRPEGSKTARICLIGEAPGEWEEQEGRPFCGPAGKLLDQALNSAGIARSECYITNVIKTRPPKNDISPYYDQKRGFTAAGREHVDALREELASCNANVFVPLGNVPLAALTNLTSITKYRGSVLESTLLPGRKVLGTIHPAAALREYLFKWPIISDLKRVRVESNNPHITRIKREILIQPSFTEVMSHLEMFKREKMRLANDIEVVNQELSCIGFAWSPTHAIVIPIAPLKEWRGWSEQEEKEIWLGCADVLEDPEIEKFGHNYMFDITFMQQKWNINTKGKIGCTLVGHHVNYYDFPKSLAFCTSIYAHEPYYKDEGKMWKDPSITKEGFWRYCGLDCTIDFECKIAIDKELDRKGTRRIYNHPSMGLFPVLEYMQLRGIRSDRAALAKTKEEVMAKQEKLQAELDLMVGEHMSPKTAKKQKEFLNVGSSDQCIKYFYIKKGIKPYINPKTKMPTSDDKAMARMARKGIREAYLVQEIRGLRTLRSRYLDIEFDTDNRLRCSYNAGKDGTTESGTGTSTGRLSSSQTIFGTGANLQNIPPEFKTFLLADEGCILVEVDKRQAEWLDVAFIVGDANMIEVYTKNIDAHIKTGSMMTGAPPDLIKAEDKIVGKTTDEVLIEQLRRERIPEILKYNVVKSMSVRQMGKKSNHSFNYGLSPMGFSIQYLVDFQEAKKCYELYHRSYPTIQAWHKQVIAQLQRNRTLVSCFGRVRWFADRWGEDLFKAAYSFMPQSEVADGLNLGLEKIYADQEGCMRKVDLLGQVHDSVLFQYPLDSLGELAQALVKICEYLEPEMEHGGRTFVIPTDAKIGLNWGQMVELNKPPEKLSKDPAAVEVVLRAAVAKLTAEGKEKCLVGTSTTSSQSI